MGSYGIGVSRLFAAIIEVSHDENGIIWPESVAPFKYAVLDGLHLIEKGDDILYQLFKKHNLDFIYDDKQDSLGEKFKRWDLFGVPYQIIIGKNYRDDKKIEVRNRKTKEAKLYSVDEFLTLSTQYHKITSNADKV
jgi:prolyl-tRNA synthetase